MTKGDAFMIISQIYVVGSFISDKNKGLLNFAAVFWMVLSIIAWGVK